MVNLDNNVVAFMPVTEPWWDSGRVFIIGGGPSLSGRPLLQFVRNIVDSGKDIVLGVNNAGACLPVHAAFSLDVVFMEKMGATLSAAASRGREVFFAVPHDYEGPRFTGIHYIFRDYYGMDGISTDPHNIVGGFNSGYGAVNLAILKRAREIVLLGYDMQQTPLDRAHWHAENAWWDGSTMIYYDRWAAKFSEIAACLPPNVSIYNANTESAIRCFPFRSYAEFGL